MLGVLQPTLQSAELVNGKITVSEVLPAYLQDRPHLGDGDGAVPQVSATPVQMKDREMLSVVDYIAESHGALQNQPNLLPSLLKGLQALQTPSQTDVRGGLEQVSRVQRSGVKGLGLSLKAFYLVNEPVTLRAKVSGTNVFHTLRAEITCLNGDRPVMTGDFVNDNDQWVMTTDTLAAGLY
jgi:hypothetical protein